MIFSCFTRRSFQNVHQPWWTAYNDFYPVATEVSSNLLSLAWWLRLDPIVGSNAPKPNPMYHSKCALSARKCIARLKEMDIYHWNFPFKSQNVRTVSYGKQSLRHLGPKTWSLILENFKKLTILKEFKRQMMET